MKEMASNQSMTQAIAKVVAETYKAAILAVRELGSTGEHIQTTQVMPMISGPRIKHPTFDWKALDKYNELHNFEIEVRDIVLINSCNIQESKMVPIIMIKLGYKGL